MTCLVIAESLNGNIAPASLAAIAAANQIEPEVEVLVLGEQSAQAAEVYAKGEGVGKVFFNQSAHNEQALAEEWAEITLSLHKTHSYVAILAAATTSGKNFLPRVAAQLDIQPISEISAVLSSNTFSRPMYAGNCIETIESSQAVNVITVRQTSFDALTQGNGNASVEEFNQNEALGLSSFVENKVVKSDRPELTSAGTVVSGGRGVGSQEDFKLIEQLADKIGAATGASRAAVDSGYAPNDWQVGQTGKIVAPTLYVAVGISGAIQHLAGMKDSKVIVAINKDAEAPIFQIADYGLVADLFTAVPEIIEQLD